MSLGLTALHTESCRIPNVTKFCVDQFVLPVVLQWFKCDDAWITKATLDDVLQSEG